MSRPAELTAPSRGRRRCTAGYHDHSCKKRSCEICGLVWAKDWRVVLFANLKHVGCPVMFSAVTPPGQDRLPYDARHCSQLGPHRHNGKLGCRIDSDALAQWSADISRRWKRLHNAARNAVKRKHGRCLPLLLRAWEPQKRGAAHMHPVFAVATPQDVRLAPPTSRSPAGWRRSTASASSAGSVALAGTSWPASGQRHTCRATSFGGRRRKRP
jgi:hypothetical protein